MHCRPITFCLLNYITENIQVTEGRMRPAGRMLVSPDLYVVSSRRTNERSLGTFKQQCSLGNRGALYRKVLSLFSCINAAPRRSILLCNISYCTIILTVYGSYWKVVQYIAQ